jgi:alanine racemase
MNKKLMQWVEIDQSALTHNIHQFRRLIGKNKKLLATVKANAYGHGMLEVAEIALKAGTDWLGVHSIEEGVRLRQKKMDCPILVLGYASYDQLEQAVEQDLRITVYNPETIECLSELAAQSKSPIRLHVKVETGTHRQGIREEDLLSFVEKIQEHPGLVLEGMSSHFANIEDTTDHSYARTQLDNFRRTVQMLEQQGIEIPIKHIACTAATILFPETYFDMVRIGIGMYGLWPSKETFLSCILQNRKPMKLKPVLAWKTRVAQIKKIPKGAYVGYGCTFRATRDTVLAVLPIGYYDGYSRNFSNAAYVLIKGQRAPVRGRVAMDFIMTDVTDIPDVRVEDEVVLLGEDEGESITADDLAALTGTINYEIVTRINPQIPRITVTH